MRGSLSKTIEINECLSGRIWILGESDTCRICSILKTAREETVNQNRHQYHYDIENWPEWCENGRK